MAFSVDANTGELSVNVGLTSGNYAITITATDGGGLSASIEVHITVIGTTVTTDQPPEKTTKKKKNGAGRLSSCVVYLCLTYIANVAWLAPWNSAAYFLLNCSFWPHSLSSP